MKAVKLGQVCQLHYGKALQSYQDNDPKESPIRVYGTNGPIGWTKTALIEQPTIIVGRKGAYRGVHFSKRPSWTIDTAYFLTTTSNDIDLEWLYYRLLLVDINRMDTGAAIPSTKREDFYAAKVYIPSRDSQTRIASILSAYDDLIENNRRRIQLLEQAARLLYKEWFIHLRFPGHEQVKIKDGMPEGWERKKISKVCETIGGGTPSTRISEYWDGNIPWVVPSDVTKSDSLVLLDTERKITEKGLRGSSAKIVPSETILMTSRASVGFFALMDFEVCTNQGFINIIPYKDELRMYLLFNLMSRVAKIRSNAKGTTYPEISKGRFRGMDVVIPSKTLLDQFSKVSTDVIRQVRYLKRSMLQLEAARDLLLPRLMNGEVAI